MTDGDLALARLLDPLVPRQDEPVEWEDVLRRAASQDEARRPARLPARRLAVAAIALAVLVGAALSPVGTAIADGVGDFSAWIRGEPGEPATPAEQEAFQRANERSWVSFAPDAKLRRLIATEVSGTSFVLYGFRSGSQLCLRLTASGRVSETATHCAPLYALQATDKPAVVVANDESFGTTDVEPNEDGYMPEAYATTFGIASDGVASIMLRGDDGTHRASVAGNAFLYVADHPKLGTRTHGARAVAANGSKVALPLQPAPFGTFDLPPPPEGKVRGPSRVERRLSGGTIGWLERLEPRGDSVPPVWMHRFLSVAAHTLGGAHVLMARSIQPDPGDLPRIVFVAASKGETMAGPDARICTFIVERDLYGGGGCLAPDQLFGRGRSRENPFTLGVTNRGADQYSQFSGIASDDVAKLVVYLATGANLDVPLKDNAYAVRIPRSDFPIRLVAYDREGRVIGIHTETSDGMTSNAPPEAKNSVRRLAKVIADGGATAVLKAGTPVGGYRCWSITMSDGSQGGGCSPWPVREQPLLLVSADPTAGDIFLTGQVPSSVAWVRATYADGATERIEPIDGFVVHAVPSRSVRDGRLFVGLRAFDGAGKQIDERGISVRR